METHEARDSPPASAPSPGRRLTILVVDDEADMLENVARIFRRSPYACLTATSGQEALALMEREAPDLILTDLRMPGMDGLALLREAQQRRPGTPVVVVTAYASDEAAQRSLDAGARALLPKPFTSAELLRTVADALDHHRGDRAGF